MNPFKELGRTRVVSFVCLALTACALACPALCQTSPPPPAPVLTNVYPDRVAQGDLITLTGSHLIPDGSSPSVYVTFNPTIQVFVNPSSDSQISVIVPQGATDGPVTVTTNCVVDGKAYTQTSNPANILVIWKDFDLGSLFPGAYIYGNTLVPGNADNIIVRRNSQDYRTYVYEINSDGGVATLLVRPMDNIIGAGMTRNPLTGDFFTVTVNASNQRQIVNKNTGAVLYSCPNYYAANWCPCTVCFDSLGNLIVAGAIWVGPYLFSWQLCVWRFAPGDTISLDPNNANSLMLGGAAAGWAWEGDMAVGGNGTIYAVALDHWAGPTNLWILPSRDGQPYEKAMPGYGGWFLTADCTGRGYGVSPCLNGLPCDALPVVYLLPDMTPLAYPSGVYSVVGFAADAYGDLYLMGDAGSGGKPLVKRVLPSEFVDPHYYDDFDCCSVQAALKAAALSPGPKAGETPPPRVGVRIPPDVCEVGGALKVKLFPDPGDLGLGDTGGSPTIWKWIEGNPPTGKVTFGEPPRLEAYWDDGIQGHTPIAEKVKWELVKDSEKAPNADPKGLYPNKPESLFTGNIVPGQAYENTTLRFQTVHTGQFQLKITTTDKNHTGSDNQPATLTFTIAINAPNGLGGGNPENFAPDETYPSPDALIIQYADKYGVAPQYIKAIAYHETGGSYDPMTYRYELYSIDKKWISTWSDSQWQAHDYFMYRFPRTTAMPDEDVASRDKYSQITNLDFAKFFPYTCGSFTVADAPVTLYEIYAADDGWYPGSWPNLYYGVRGPCGQRMNWMREAGISMAWHLGQFYCGGTQTLCTGGTEEQTATWLLNHSTYEAQTAVASSYGLMQVLYTTAVGELNWNADEPGTNRHPASLFDVPTNLDLGCHFLARQGTTRSFDQLSFSSFLAWHYGFSLVFYHYNGSLDYAAITGAWSFRPYPINPN